MHASSAAALFSTSKWNTINRSPIKWILVPWCWKRCMWTIMIEAISLIHTLSSLCCISHFYFGTFKHVNIQCSAAHTARNTQTIRRPKKVIRTNVESFLGFWSVRFWRFCFSSPYSYACTVHQYNILFVHSFEFSLFSTYNHHRRTPCCKQTQRPKS